MATISKIKFNGTSYDLVDSAARSGLASVNTTLSSKANTEDVYLKTDADNTFATKSALSGKADETSVASRFETVNTTLGTKANANDVYDRNTADTTFATISSLNGYTTSEVFTAYQTTVSGQLNDKANTSDVYDKTAADGKFATNTNLENNYKTKSELNTDYAGIQGDWSSSVHGVQGDIDALTARIDAIEGSESVLETLNKITAELQNPDSAEGITSFLDTVADAMNEGEVVDNDTRYNFNYVPEKDENDEPIPDVPGTLEITSDLVTNAQSVWVPRGAQSDPTPEPEP